MRQSVKSDIEKLKRAISDKDKKIKSLTKKVNEIKQVTPEPVTEPVTPEPVTEPVTPEPVTEPVIPEPVTEPVTPGSVTEPVTPESVTEPVTPESVTPNTLSLFSDIKQKTEQDGNIISDISNNFINDIPLTQEASSTETNKVRAGIYITLADTGFWFICLLITWDFSKENQGNFRLDENRKKSIQKAIFDVLELEKGKKKNPKSELWLLILGSYVPMIITAIFMLVAKMKAKKEQKEHERLSQNNYNPVNYGYYPPEHAMPIEKSKRGRKLGGKNKPKENIS